MSSNGPHMFGQVVHVRKQVHKGALPLLTVTFFALLRSQKSYGTHASTRHKHPRRDRARSFRHAAVVATYPMSSAITHEGFGGYARVHPHSAL